ncbi:MAG: heme-binding protein [Actinobacteria bacterium]|nr:heme-binding protein [Actinomycetota bacterium]
MARAAPLTAAVLDPGGHLVVLRRKDGAGIVRPQIACGNAWARSAWVSAARGSRRVAAARPAFMGCLTADSGGRLIAAAGGVLICETRPGSLAPSASAGNPGGRPGVRGAGIESSRFPSRRRHLTLLRVRCAESYSIQHIDT